MQHNSTRIEETAINFMSTNELLNVTKLAERISVPVWTIRKLIREQRIPAYKIGRNYLCDPVEVIQYIKETSKV